MNNQRIAGLFYEMADLLDILAVAWKPIAYRKAARTIESLQEDVDDIFKKGGIKALEDLPGIGEGIAKKIIEFIETGGIKAVDDARKKLPKGILELLKVRGLGPKRAKVLYQKLGIKSVGDLEEAAMKHRIRELAGFGEKSEREFLDAISFVHKDAGRVLLGTALPLSREIARALKKVEGVEDVVVCGSVRRRKETCKDIDILAIAKNAAKVMEAFTTLPDVVKVTGKGPTKSGVILSQGISADLRVLKPESFGAAVQYFTGNKDHNVAVRQIALKKGLTLSEYGLFTVKGHRYVCGRQEKEIYEKLGLLCVPPEMRENTGELQLKRMPDLVDDGMLKGDCHMHTLWSDGDSPPEDMIAAAKKLEYEYVAITDHSKSATQANGMSERRLASYIRKIENLKRKHDDINVLVGSEVDILPSGNLDYGKDLLDRLDFVVACVHSAFKMDREAMTDRLLKALSDEHVNVFGHPTARNILARPMIDFDHEKVFNAAKNNGVLLEINAQPKRLDLPDMLCRKAKEMGCEFIINTDSHSTFQLANSEYGVATARRGWIERKDVVNTLPWKSFRKRVLGR